MKRSSLIILVLVLLLVVISPGTLAERNVLLEADFENWDDYASRWTIIGDNTVIGDGILKTVAHANWEYSGVISKEEFDVPETGLFVEYEFYATRKGKNSSCFFTAKDGNSYQDVALIPMHDIWHRGFFAVEIFHKFWGTWMLTPDYGAAAAEMAPFELNKWYRVKIMLRPESFNIWAWDVDTDEEIFNAAEDINDGYELPKDRVNRIGVMFIDAEEIAMAGYNFWRNIVVYTTE